MASDRTRELAREILRPFHVNVDGRCIYCDLAWAEQKTLYCDKAAAQPTPEVKK